MSDVPTLTVVMTQTVTTTYKIPRRTLTEAGYPTDVAELQGRADKDVDSFFLDLLDENEADETDYEVTDREIEIDPEDAL